jgi:DeoR family fructose operon transcriptional repressor
MLLEERLSEIKNLIDSKRSCSINEIADKFCVSKATARRDLKILSERNMVRLTRGGALSLASGTTYDPPYSVKKGINHEEKKRIGQYAADLVKDGETLVLDSGSTVVELARALRNGRQVMVATNDLVVGYELANTKGIDLTFIGGAIRKNFYMSHGHFAQSTLSQINSDKVFLGLDAISLAKGCMVTNTEELVVKKLMLASAKQKIVVCDHTKFANVAFLKLCDLQEIDMIITGCELDDKIYESIISEGINIVRV